MTTLKPFHESIVDVLDSFSFYKSIRALGHLIVATKIPANHDAIIAAWQAKVRNGYNEPETTARVLEHLRSEAEAAKS